MTDFQKIELLVQYVVGAAAKEHFPDNRLGTIHILKYIYLADLAYSEKHGETFTGAQWKFYHFGPWCPVIHDQIAVVTEKSPDIDVHQFRGEFGEFCRYSSRRTNMRENLESKLPIVVSRAIDRAIKRYGANTPALLEAVYLTKPMRNAVPNESLAFDMLRPSVGAQQITAEELSAKKKKKRAQKVEEIRARVRAEKHGRKAPVGQHVAYTSPRYDAVFEMGTAALNEASASFADDVQVDLKFDDSVWKSDIRRDEDVP